MSILPDTCPRCGGQYKNNPDAPGCPACDRGQELFRRNAWGLLHLIAAGLNQHNDKALWHLEVILFDADHEELKRIDVPTCLDLIANGIWWDETGSWAHAVIAKVEVL